MRLLACVVVLLGVAVAGAQDPPTISGITLTPRPPSIYHAVRLRDADAVRFYVDQGVDVNEPDRRGDLLLWIALETNDPNILGMVLDAGANLKRTKGDQKISPLHETALDSKLPLTQVLLDHGAVIEAVDFDGHTPLLRAAWDNQTETAKLLLERGANPLAKSRIGQTLLQLAALRQNFSIAELAIKGGVDVNAKGPAGSTALHIAASTDRINIVQLLLEHRANTAATDADLFTPLHAASQAGAAAAVRAIAQAGADLNARTRNGQTPLLLAAGKGSPEAVSALLDAGADPAIEDDEGHTPLLVAIQESRSEIVELLIGDESDHAANADGTTPLMAAAGEGAIEIARTLLANGSSPTRVNLDRGWNALHYAIARNDAPMVRLLLDNGADRTSRTGLGLPPLHLAVEFNAPDALRELANAGADVNEEQTHTGWTPLFSAVSRGDQPTVLVLIELGADLDLIDMVGRNLLHVAALQDRGPITALLIGHGVDFQIADAHGDTPLHAAASANAANVAAALLNAGADVAIKNSEGETPIDIARANQFIALAERLDSTLDPTFRARRDLLASMDREVVEDGNVGALRNASVTPRELLDAGRYLLHQAAVTDTVDTVRGLIKAGWSVSTRDAEGLQPLHHAAGAGAAVTTRALLLNKAALNDQKNVAKYTPLHFAAVSGNEATVQALLDKGADPSLHNVIGQTPADLARLADHPEIAAVLEVGHRAAAAPSDR